jgi:signal transduction histidine kinase
MYAEMLEEGMITENEKREQYLKTIRRESERLSRLIENVLAYARLERGASQRRTETVRLREFLRRIRDTLDERAQQAGMSITIETEEHVLLSTARADFTSVEQILFNLIDNACKYAASGADRLIEIEVQNKDRAVTFAVRDHGPGVSRAGEKRLFRPFFKSAGEAANSAPGVGLGLALSRRLARQMGGDLRLDRTVTDGARFLLTIPAG